MSSQERYLPSRPAFDTALNAHDPIGAIVFRDVYGRETAEWFVTPFDDAAELFSTMYAPGSSDLPNWKTITLDECTPVCANVDTITRY